MNTNTVDTKREAFERKVLARFGHAVQIMDPDRHYLVFKRLQPYFDGYSPTQDVPGLYSGSYGFSPSASALYANGFNPRGLSKVAPFGLLYGDFGNDNLCFTSVFSIGYFRKPGSKEGEDGYMMILCPQGDASTMDLAVRFARNILCEQDIPCAGVYFRFLDFVQWNTATSLGLRNISGYPWHPKAVKEDETFCHSSLFLPKVIELSGSGFRVLDLQDAPDKYHRRKSRMAFKRFENFLSRNGLEFCMKRLMSEDSEKNCKIAMEIIRSNFARMDNHICSVAEDYLGICDPRIFRLPDIHAYVGYLARVPIAVFIGEEIAGGSVGLYTAITLHDARQVLPELGIAPESQKAMGFSAVSMAAQMHYFANLLAKGITTVKLGGSETKELDDQKRQLGAKEDETYWLALMR